MIRRTGIELNPARMSKHSEEDNLWDTDNHSMGRDLATLRMGNSTPEFEKSGFESSSESVYAYTASNVVTLLHRAPRGIGHTNQLASLFDSDLAAISNSSFRIQSIRNNDYADGIKLFVGFFVITPFLLWFIILVAFKIKYSYHNKRNQRVQNLSIHDKSYDLNRSSQPKTTTKVVTTATESAESSSSSSDIPINCWIAGGSVIDMIKLSRAGVKRKERKSLLLRSWRIQSIFLSASIGIPILSVVLMEFGWRPLEQAAREIQDLNQDFEALAYRGWNAMDGLELSRNNLFSQNELVREILSFDVSNNHTAHNAGRKLTRCDDKHEAQDQNKDNRNLELQWQHRWNYQGTLFPTEFHTDMALSFQLTQVATSPPTAQFGLTDEAFESNRANSDNDAASTVNVGKKSEWLEKTQVTKVPMQLPSLSPSLDTNEIELSLLNEFNETSMTNSSTTSETLMPYDSSIEIFAKWCPNAVIDETLWEFWSPSVKILADNIRDIYEVFLTLDEFFPFVQDFESGYTDDNGLNDEMTSSEITSHAPFQFITSITNSIDNATEWFFANDWLLKMLILILNVINGLLLASVFFLSKNNIIHQPTQFYLAYVLVPLFGMMTCCIVAITIATSVGILINVDFCSGGHSQSPRGTVQEIISSIQKQQRNEEVSRPSDPMSLETMHILHNAVDYFWTGCLTENPLQFLEDFAHDVDNAAANLNQIMTSSEGTSSPPPIFTSIDSLNQVCNHDMSFLPPSILDLEIQIDRIKIHIQKLSDTISCGQISPLLRRVSHGSICVESPEALTVIWGSSFGIGILCFILLTVRAALFNSVKYKKRRPTKPRRVVEKEFEEYKTFMSKYYGEVTTSEWKMDIIPLPSKKLQFVFDKDIESSRTFETDITTKGSGSHEVNLEDVGSEIGGIHLESKSNGDYGDCDSSSYGSSFDSEGSDDNHKQKSGIDEDGQYSIIGSILSDTSKSIAMKTLHSLRQVKPLLLSTRKSQKQVRAEASHPQVIGNIASKPQTIGNRIPICIGNERQCYDAPVVVEDDTSQTNSIDDESLYIATSKSMSGNLEDRECIFDSNANSKLHHSCSTEETKTQCNKLLAKNLPRKISPSLQSQSWTPSNMITSLQSPRAPKKEFSVISRTLFLSDKQSDLSLDETKSLII